MERGGRELFFFVFFVSKNSPLDSSPIKKKKKNKKKPRPLGSGSTAAPVRMPEAGRAEAAAGYSALSLFSYRVHVRDDGLYDGPLVRHVVEQIERRVQNPRRAPVGRRERGRREEVRGQQVGVGADSLRERRRGGRGGRLPPLAKLLLLELSSRRSCCCCSSPPPSQRRGRPRVVRRGPVDDPHRRREQPVHVPVGLRAVELDPGVAREHERRAGEGEGRRGGRRSRG
jgi:hypothetical protein